MITFAKLTVEVQNSNYQDMKGTKRSTTGRISYLNWLIFISATILISDLHCIEIKQASETISLDTKPILSNSTSDSNSTPARNLLVTTSTAQDSPKSSKANLSLKKLALKQSRRWARQLSLKGINSLTSRREGNWGVQTLDRVYKNVFKNRQTGEKGKQMLQRSISNVMTDRNDSLNNMARGIFNNGDNQTTVKPVNMMDMSNKLYEFMDRHGIRVKTQADNNEHIRYVMYQRKHLSSTFDVKLNAKKEGYSVDFISQQPLKMKKSLKIDSGKELDNQMMPFLESSYKNWRKTAARELKQLDLGTSKRNSNKSNLNELDLDNKSFKDVIKNDKNSQLKEKTNNLKASITKNTEKKDSNKIVNSPSLSILSDLDKSMERALSSPAVTITNPIKNEEISEKKQSVHFIDALNEHSRHLPMERSLTEVDHIGSLLEQALSDSLAISQEDTHEWSIAVKTKDDQVGDKICTVKVNTDEQDRQMLEISNKGIDFLVNNQKMAARMITKEDEDPEVVAFIHEQLNLFTDIYLRVIGQEYNLMRLSDFLKEEVFQPRQVELINNSVITSKPDEDGKSQAIYVILDELDADNNIITQIRCFTVNSMFNQIELSHREREIELQVPRQMNKTQKDMVKDEIYQILDDQASNNTVNYTSSLHIIKDILENTEGCGSIEISETMLGNTTIISIPDGASCAFEAMSLVLTGYDYGYLQYLHIMLNNQYFQTEHLVAFNQEEDFMKNMNDILSDMSSEIEAVKETNEKTEDSNNITLESITQIIKESLGDLVQESEAESDDHHEVLFKRETPSGKEITTIRILVLPGPDGDEDNTLFRVFMFDPRTHSSKNKDRSKSHHEYMMYGKNGVDELKIFSIDLNKLKEKIIERRRK